MELAEAGHERGSVLELSSSKSQPFPPVSWARAPEFQVNGERGALHAMALFTGRGRLLIISRIYVELVRRCALGIRNRLVRVDLAVRELGCAVTPVCCGLGVRRLACWGEVVVNNTMCVQAEVSCDRTESGDLSLRARSSSRLGCGAL